MNGVSAGGGASEANADGGARRAVVIHNPTKGDGSGLREALADASRAAGWSEPLWLETTPDDGGQGRAREALAAGADVVVVSGGDGTVRCVAEGLRDSDVPLALAPAGTGNLLARNLALPLSSLEQSVDVALTGRTRSVDLGVATLTAPDGSQSEHAFAVMAGLGLDAAMIANARPALKRHVGWLAYVDSGVRSLRRATNVRVRFSVDEQGERAARVSTILVGNCGSLPGGIELLPDARIDDALLDVALLQPRSILGWLAIWRRVAWENRVLRRSSLGRRIIRLTGTRRSRRLITYLRGESVRIAVDEPEPFELDGDEFGEVVAVELRVDAGGLLVRVPDVD